MIITSPANEKIKQIRKLRERKYRSETGQFLVEGLRITTEAFQMGAMINLLVVAPDLLTSDFGRELVVQVRNQEIPVLEVNRSVFESLAVKENPQGIAAVIRQQWSTLADFSAPGDQDWIALESVADPGNLGTILRTSDGAGWAGVILLGNCTDPYDPSALRASMGAVFSQHLVRATFAEFVQWKLETGIRVVGTSDSAEQDYHYLEYPAPMVLLMGSERQGLSEEQIQVCDELARIPMVGRSDSLNLSIATAVMIYEIYNHRRDRPDFRRQP